jgi:hypothetical protein
VTPDHPAHTAATAAAVCHGCSAGAHGVVCLPAAVCTCASWCHARGNPSPSSCRQDPAPPCLAVMAAGFRLCCSCISTMHDDIQHGGWWQPGQQLTGGLCHRSTTHEPSRSLQGLSVRFCRLSGLCNGDCGSAYVLTCLMLYTRVASARAAAAASSCCPPAGGRSARLWGQHPLLVDTNTLTV